MYIYEAYTKMLLFPVCHKYICASFAKPNGLSVQFNCMLGKVDFCFLLKEHIYEKKGEGIKVAKSCMKEERYQVR